MNSQGLRELEALPGLGRYSARAILCLAYGQAVPMIDEGSGRVLRRALGLSVNGPSYASRPLMQAAEEIIPERSAAEFSLGLIDIAARFCRPRMALCSECPLVSGCEHARGSTVASGGASQMAAIDDLLDRLPDHHREALLWFAQNAGTEVSWPDPLSGGTLLATRAKGIYKPAWTEYALSVRTTLDSPYSDGEREPGPSGSGRCATSRRDLTPSSGTGSCQPLHAGRGQGLLHDGFVDPRLLRGSGGPRRSVAEPFGPDAVGGIQGLLTRLHGLHGGENARVFIHTIPASDFDGRRARQP